MTYTQRLPLALLVLAALCCLCSGQFTTTNVPTADLRVANLLGNYGNSNISVYINHESFISNISNPDITEYLMVAANDTLLISIDFGNVTIATKNITLDEDGSYTLALLGMPNNVSSVEISVWPDALDGLAAGYSRVQVFNAVPDMPVNVYINGSIIVANLTYNQVPLPFTDLFAGSNPHNVVIRMQNATFNISDAFTNQDVLSTIFIVGHPPIDPLTVLAVESQLLVQHLNSTSDHNDTTGGGNTTFPDNSTIGDNTTFPDNSTVGGNNTFHENGTLSSPPVSPALNQTTNSTEHHGNNKHNDHHKPHFSFWPNFRPHQNEKDSSDDHGSSNRNGPNQEKRSWRSWLPW